MSDMDMNDLLAVFLEEAEEQLQKLDDGFLQIEKEPNNPEILKEVFRAAHTLKGSSGTMGYTDMANLTHKMENLLDSLRNDQLEVSTERIDVLLKGTDELRVMMDQLRTEGKIDHNVDELAEEIAALNQSDGSTPAAKKESSPEAADGAAEEGAGIPFEIQKEDSLVISVHVDPECVMPGVRAFMVYNSASGLGEVVQADPAEDGIDDIQAGQPIHIEIVPNQDAETIESEMKKLSEIVFNKVYTREEIEAIRNKAEANPQDEPKAESQESRSADDNKAADAPVKTEAAPKVIQTIRVGVDRLDTLMNLVAELVIDKTRIGQIENDLSSKYEGEELVQGLGETAAHIGRVVTELQEHIMKVRLLPVEQVFNRFPRMIRDISNKAGKEIDFEMVGQETELDRSILEEIVDPLTHLLRNSVDHGVESPEDREKTGKPRRAKIILAAKQEENRIIIEVQDDGHGIDIEKVKAAALKKGAVTEEALGRMNDHDALQLIFASGLSTAEKITDLSGRGVGMDVVRSNIQGLSGSVDVSTELGKGTTVKISLPLTLAIIQSLVTGVDDRVFVIPLSAVAETFRCSASEIRHIDKQPAINFRGTVLPLINLGNIFEPKGGDDKPDEVDDSKTFVVVNTGSVKIGLVVDKLIGEQEVVIKPLGAFFGDLMGIAGATILGDGRVALIVDVAGLGGIINRRRFRRPVSAAAQSEE